MNDFDILRALVMQVMNATPKGKNERDVTTLITRPMWKAFCRAAGMPKNCSPSIWPKTRLVCGSKTIVLDVPLMFAVSFVQ
jgi:hypothetical protein